MRCETCRWDDACLHCSTRLWPTSVRSLLLGRSQWKWGIYVRELFYSSICKITPTSLNAASTFSYITWAPLISDSYAFRSSCTHPHWWDLRTHLTNIFELFPFQLTCSFTWPKWITIILQTFIFGHYLTTLLIALNRICAFLLKRVEGVFFERPQMHSTALAPSTLSIALVYINAGVFDCYSTCHQASVSKRKAFKVHENPSAPLYLWVYWLWTMASLSCNLAVRGCSAHRAHLRCSVYSSRYETSLDTLYVHFNWTYWIAHTGAGKSKHENNSEPRHISRVASWLFCIYSVM